MLPVRSLTVAVLETDVDSAYPGGVSAFRRDFPGTSGRGGLLRLPVPAFGHSALLRQLKARGVPAGAWSGATNYVAELVPHPGIAMLTGRTRKVGILCKRDSA